MITQTYINNIAYKIVGCAIEVHKELGPGVFENVMVETGIETNGMIEIKSEIDPAKKVVITGAYAINSEYKFRKGSDPMEGMKM